METCSCTPVPRLHQSQLPHQLGSGADHLLRQVATKRVPAAGANKGRRGGACMVASPRGWHPELAAAGWAACTGECTAHAPRSNLLTAHLHTSRHQAKPRLLRVPTCQVLGHLAAALHGGPREATWRRRRQQTPSRYGSCGGILVQLRALAHRHRECLPMVQGRGQGNLPSAGWEASSPTSACDDSTTAGTTA